MFVSKAKPERRKSNADIVFGETVQAKIIPIACAFFSNSPMMNLCRPWPPNRAHDDELDVRDFE